MEHHHHEMMNIHATATASDASSFCTGDGVIMFMDGFHWSLAGQQHCLNLLFANWTLHNRFQFILALVGVFCYAVAVEYLAKLRIRAHTFCKIHKGFRPVIPLLHGLQALAGYSLMLITMTFSLELFLAVVGGLTVGYYLFFHVKTNTATSSVSREETQQLMQHVTTNPCCEFMESESRELLPGSLALEEDSNEGIAAGLG